ncbi:hypothetical protein PsorP6_006079 [Peronosclerospora sorghi]|uniref:Uncharacterized protein n=1 Tax=Peronosclerospora sorghi TaxID=230839 RepID=A0ACC0W5E0_9STRA|nr:hypothetical protein PsorP6_006079 [Peronosclerospora sorghi]
MGTWNYMLKIKFVDLNPIFKGLDSFGLITSNALKIKPTLIFVFDTLLNLPLMVLYDLYNAKILWPFISKPVTKVGFNDCCAQCIYQRAGTENQSMMLLILQLSASVKNTNYDILLPSAEQTSSFASSAVK